MVLAVTCCVATVASAQNVRSAVSVTGSDVAACTVPDPCRTFNVAISSTNPGGEVIVLSTGGYGPFTVTQSVSIISPSGFHAVLAPTSGTAINVSAPGATVVLRNLSVNSLGASSGVSINTGGTVHIERLVVNGFGANGIELISQSGTAKLFVNDSEIRNSGASGIYLGPASGNVIASLDHVRLESNSTAGLAADSGVDVSVRESVAVRNGYFGTGNFFFRNGGALPALRAAVERSLAADSPGYGFYAYDGARLTVRDSAAIRNSRGFAAEPESKNPEMVLYHCLASENHEGIAAINGPNPSVSSDITVSNSTVLDNHYGIVAYANGVIRAFGNTVTRNGMGMLNGSGSEDSFRSGGHNSVDGNSTDTFGPITTVPTI